MLDKDKMLITFHIHNIVEKTTTIHLIVLTHCFVKRKLQKISVIVSLYFSDVIAVKTCYFTFNYVHWTQQEIKKLGLIAFDFPEDRLDNGDSAEQSWS